MTARLITLGDICEFSYGKSLPASQREAGQIKVYGSNGPVGTHVQSLLDGPAIIVGRKGSYGEVHYSEGPLWPIDTTYYIDASSTDCNLRWLHYLLKFLPLTTLNKSAAIPGLNREDAYRLQVSVPPLDEQRRIAAILDKADALSRKSKQILRSIDQLGHALYRETFGDPVSNSAKLITSTLGDLGVEMIYGPRFYNEEYKEDGVRIVRITDLSESGELDYAAMPKLRVSDDDLLNHRSRPGELLFARTGATVGKVALISANDPTSIPGAYFIRLRFPDSIEPMFAWYTLRSPPVQEIIAERSRQSAQQNFSGPGLRRLPFIIPPLAQQRAFIARLLDIHKYRNILRGQIAGFDALFFSLQHRAFSGQL